MRDLDASVVGGPRGGSAMAYVARKAAEAQARLDALAAAGQPFVPRYRIPRDAAEEHQRALDAAMATDWQAMTLDRFRGYTVELRSAAGEVAEFIEDPRGTLYLWGDTGTGKTHLAAGAAIRLLERGYLVRVYRAADVGARLRAAAAEGAAAHETAMNRLKNVRVLVIDDFAAEHVTDFLAAEWFDLLDYRYRQYAATILTANVHPDHLAMPRLASRFQDQQRARTVALSGRDYRTFATPPAAELTAADFAPPRTAPADCPTCHGASIVKRDLAVGHPWFGRAFPCPTCRGAGESLRNGGIG